MKTRKVRVINTKTQEDITFESSASTLGELKRDLKSKGMDTEGLVFHEGHLKAEFTDNNSTFPEVINYKGKTIDDLIFMLTVPNKKIASGILRKEAYDIIKKNNLADECRRRFGKNYTNVPTKDLEQLVSPETFNSPEPDNIKTVLVTLIDMLCSKGIITKQSYEFFSEKLGVVPLESDIEKEDANSLFDYLRQD